MADERFSHIAKDPRFRQLNFKHRKVKIDKRFEGMFKDKRFKLKYSVDKRGRPIKTSTNEDLQRFYELSDSEPESSEDENSDNDYKAAVEGSAKQGKLTGNESQKNKKKVRKPKMEKEKDDKAILDMTHKTKKAKVQKKDTQGKDIKGKKASLPSKSNTKDSNVEEEEFDEDRESAEESEDDSESEDSNSYNPEEGDGIDLARGQGNVETSSSEEESSPEEDNGVDDEGPDHPWGELAKDAPIVEDATRRLAVCNMDWDRIKAQDLLMLFNSFKPTGGVIHSVTIYPSEYGLERMKEEDLLGPRELRGDQNDSKAKDDDSEYHRERLRTYQLNRLKYYYGVVECDSTNTANHLYSECDGLEYESSAAVLDLRFIPDDMTFDQTPKEVAKDIADASSYKPTLFSTSALQQSHVNLTWDETDQDRVTLLRKKYSKEDLENMKVDEYLASESDEEQPGVYSTIEQPDAAEASSGDEEDQIEKYRQLLLGGTSREEGEEKDMEMEFSWEPGLKESSQEDVEEKRKEKSKDTPWEQYLQKKKEKKKAKKNERKEKLGQTEKPFSDDDLPEDFNVDDEFFQQAIDERRSKVKKGKEKKGKKTVTAEEQQEQGELSLLTLDEDDRREHFNMEQIMKQEQGGKKKKKKRVKEAQQAEAESTFEINVKDKRFTALYDSAAYNIDPSAPEFKKTKAMEAIISEKLKRREMEETNSKDKKTKKDSTKRPASEKLDDVPSGHKKGKVNEPSKDINLANLVKSVKAKTQSLKQKKAR